MNVLDVHTMREEIQGLKLFIDNNNNFTFTVFKGADHMSDGPVA